MKIKDHLAQAKDVLFSIEILPPLKGANIQSVFKAMDPLMEFKPPFVDVTYHREEHVYKEHSNGLLERISTRKRPGTVGICAAIMNHYQVDAVPHIICGGFNKEETENALIDLNFLGIDNVLVLRGDPIKSETYFTPTESGHRYASELIDQVVQLNQGKYLDNDIINPTPSDFCIGVAGYPEKHYEAPNLDMDMEFLKLKIDKGADYIVTQMFFDNKKYFNFVDKCRASGITVPIIPGLKPISIERHLTVLPHRFNIDLPEDLVKAVRDCKNNKDIRQVGVEWSVQQCKELIDYGAPCLHFYSMGNSDNIYKVAKEVF